MTDVLKIDNLFLKRGVFSLKNISFDVHDEELFALIGKTGSGKTLLLEAIAGFSKLDHGRVLYRGTSVTNIPIYERNIGYLYQDYSLFPHMTAYNNIAYSLKCRNYKKFEIEYSVKEIAEKFEISYLLNQYPGTLSGGEQQRVALARALVMHPSLLILDEPFSALDPITKQKFYKLIVNIRNDFKCAILFVTHDFNEAQLLGDRIGVLYEGTLKGVVNSNELFSYDWDDTTKIFLGIEKD